MFPVRRICSLGG